MTVLAIDTTAEDHHLARLAAVAIGLSLLEAAFPSPVPGVKPGVANIITLLVLYLHGWKAAAWVSLLRVFSISLLLGSFLSPGFVLSLTGALTSLCVLSWGIHLPHKWFGPISLSILSAYAHIFTQLGVAYLWLVPHVGLLNLLPAFSLAALFFGALNGWIVHFVIKNMPHNA